MKTRNPSQFPTNNNDFFEVLFGTNYHPTSVILGLLYSIYKETDDWQESHDWDNDLDEDNFIYWTLRNPKAEIEICFYFSINRDGTVELTVSYITGLTENENTMGARNYIRNYVAKNPFGIFKVITVKLIEKKGDFEKKIADEERRNKKVEGYFAKRGEYYMKEFGKFDL